MISSAGTCSSVICRKPVEVSGCGLVISNRTAVVLTGSNVIVVGSSDAVANCTCWPVTATQPAPFQYDTRTELGSTRFAPTVKYGTREPIRCPFDQLTETHSLAWARLTAGSVLVADLL